MYEEAGDFTPGSDIPDDVDYPQYYPLVAARNLGNVRVFIVGEPVTPEDEIEAYYNCHTSGEAMSGIVKHMPKLEELHLYAHRVNANDLFSLRTIPDLRVLILYHSDSYPLGRLAKNPNLKKLEVLRFHTHAVEDLDEGAYIKLAGIRELVRSAELPALRHLQLRSTDAGDKGVKEIVDSGILKRLKVLDLRHGIITDKGADLLLKCADTRNLDRLDLGHNKITETKVQQLLAAGIKLEHDHQRDPDSDDEVSEGYLSSGDIE
jgi:Leucine-rich repeat (LRR) protein